MTVTQGIKELHNYDKTNSYFLIVVLNQNVKYAPCVDMYWAVVRRLHEFFPLQHHSYLEHFPAKYTHTFGAQQPNSGLRRPSSEFPISHIDTQTHTSGRTPPNKWSACHIGRYVHNTQHSPTDEHTCPHRDSKLRLRSHGQRHRNCQ